MQDSHIAIYFSSQCNLPRPRDRSQAQAAISERRAQIIAAIKASDVVESAFPKSLLPLREEIIDQFANEAISIAVGSGSGGSTAWLNLVARLESKLESKNVQPLIESVLNATRGVVGDHEYVYALGMADELDELSAMLQLRSALSMHTVLLSKKLFDYLGSLVSLELEVGFAGRQVKLVEVREDLSALLKEFGEIRASTSANLERDFICLFMHRMVKKHPASLQCWEMILFNLERLLGLLSPSKSYCALSDAIEALVWAAPRFPLIRDYAARLGPHFRENAGIADIVMLKMVLDAHPESVVARRFFAEFDASAMHEVLRGKTNWFSEKQALVVSQARDKWERVHVDYVDAATIWLGGILRTVDQYDSMESSIDRQLDMITTRITEGVTDGRGRDRARNEFALLVRWAWMASAQSNELSSARRLLRSRVTYGIDAHSNIALWRKNKEIALALAGIEFEESHFGAVSQSNVTLLLETFNSILADQLTSPLGWFGGVEHVTGAAGSAAGFRRADILGLLRRIAIGNRLHGASGALPPIRGWLTRITLSSASTMDATAATESLHKLETRLLGNTQAINRVLLELLGGVISSIPLVCASRTIALDKEKLAQAACGAGRSIYIAAGNADTPMLQKGPSDISYLLSRVVFATAQTSQTPLESVTWWWRLASAKFYTRVPRPLLATCLQGLKSTLAENLPATEAEKAFALIAAVYRNTLGISLDEAPGAEKAFQSMVVAGPIWRAVFKDSKAQFAAVEQAKAQILASCPSPILPLAESAYLLIASDGDEESASLPFLGELSRLSVGRATLQIDGAWRSWTNTVASQVGEAAFALVVPKMMRATAAIRQVGFGRKLAVHEDEVVQAFTVGCARHLQAKPVAAELRAISLFFRELSRCLQQEPASICALNSARCLLESASVLALDRHGWRSAFANVAMTLEPQLDAPERFASSFWFAQLYACTASLQDARNFGQGVLNAKQPFFTESRSEESGWRQLAGSLVAAAMTPDDAPISGRTLVQRLLLSSSTLAAETPASWGKRIPMLQSALEQFLPPDLHRRFVERCNFLLGTLFDVTQLRDCGGAGGAATFALCMGSVPHARSNWYCATYANALVEGRIASPSDTLVARLSGVNMPSDDSTRGIKQQIIEARGFVAPDELQVKRWIGSEKTALAESEQVGISVVVKLLALSPLLDAFTPRRVIAEFGVICMDQRPFESRSKALEVIVALLQANSPGTFKDLSQLAVDPALGLQITGISSSFDALQEVDGHVLSRISSLLFAFEGGLTAPEQRKYLADRLGDFERPLAADAMNMLQKRLKKQATSNELARLKGLVEIVEGVS